MIAVAVFLVRASLQRAAAIWLLAHMALPLVSQGKITPFRPIAVLVLAAVTGWASLIFSRRHNELIFLGNLGVPWQIVVFLPAGPIVLFEVILRFVLSAAAD